jgi:DNA-binding transcriptional LysR family regulator
MDIRQLQALVGIDDFGNFSTTAQALGTVQSNISTRIQRLEEELGVVLVNRDSGRVTSIGRQVVDRARRILFELESAVSDAHAFNQSVQGVVAIGMIGTVGRWLVPKLFEAQRLRYPFVSLQIVEGTNSTLEPALISSKIDLAVVSIPLASPELSSLDLFAEDLRLVLHRDHPLASRREGVRFREFADLDLLLPLTATPLRREIDAAAAAGGTTLHASLELDGVRTLASLAFDLRIPAILPATALSTHLKDQFVALPIVGTPLRRVGLASRRFGFPSEPTRVLSELLQEIVITEGSSVEGVHTATT